VSQLWSSDGGGGPVEPHYGYKGFAPTSALAQMCSARGGCSLSWAQDTARHADSPSQTWRRTGERDHTSPVLA
jgi:hypothetical protein